MYVFAVVKNPSSQSWMPCQSCRHAALDAVPELHPCSSDIGKVIFKQITWLIINRICMYVYVINRLPAKLPASQPPGLQALSQVPGACVSMLTPFSQRCLVSASHFVSLCSCIRVPA